MANPDRPAAASGEHQNPNDRHRRICTFAMSIMLTVLTTRSLIAAEPETGTLNRTAAQRLFTLKVLPLLKSKCAGCHGNDPTEIRGQFDVRSREALLQGGESGAPALIPGRPDASPLYRAVLWDGLEMPPKQNDRLTTQEVSFIRQWITAGAPWPDGKTQLRIRTLERSIRKNADGVIISTSGGQSDDWTYRRYQPADIWAFQPVQRQQVPDGYDHPIDAFIEQRLKTSGLQPAGPADFRSQIRRVTYSLTGLPPTPYEIFQFRKAFEKDSPGAWNALITRLLDSSHYGERWAQHWLDVVRYADTAGFSNDYERSNAWRYRDYVIRSFNEDKPFDEFIVEQIAGDELHPDDPEAIVATGFLRMGPWGTAMIPRAEARQLYLDDLVHSVGQTFLSIPMRCCKCHDHKFDPVPTRDYYRFYSAFSGTQPAEVKTPFLPEENRKGFSAKRKLVEELLAFATEERDKVLKRQEDAARKWYSDHKLPYRNVNARRRDPENLKPPRHIGLTPEQKGILKVREQDVWIWTRRLERYQPMAQSVYNGPDVQQNGRRLRRPQSINRKWRPDSFILGGGSLAARLTPVVPGVLSATGLPVNQEAEDPYQIPAGLDGRRLALARWIASSANPLTARSIVNRIWQYHFGAGLVRTANNFGAKGHKPTHPKLLDWLARDFVEHGWKIKRLHRLILTSQTYRRSGRPVQPEKQSVVDSGNELLASFPVRRLSAEEFRDSTLLVSGELNPEAGGVPIMPEINREVALQPRMIQFSIAPAQQPSRTPAERHRRTIYAYRVRGQADPLLNVLNQPNPNESCSSRETAAVTPQAFTLLNSEVMTDRSIAFALRVQTEKPDDTGMWIRRAVQLAYGRVPTPAEQTALHAFFSEMRKYHTDHPPEPIENPTHVVRSLVEEFTGQPFEFIEKLNVFEDYVPDAKPWTVDATTRALADVCLLLFNSNEFMYIY